MLPTQSEHYHNLLLSITAWNMESTEIEKLQLEVIQSLCRLPRVHLVDLSEFWFIAGPELEHVSGKSRTSLISLISSHLEREELKQLEDHGMAELLCFMDKVSECETIIAVPPTELMSQPPEPVDIPQKQNENENQQSRVNEEQVKLSNEIETLQLKLLLVQKQNEREKLARAAQIATPSGKVLASRATPLKVHPHGIKILR